MMREKLSRVTSRHFGALNRVFTAITLLRTLHISTYEPPSTSKLTQPIPFQEPSTKKAVSPQDSEDLCWVTLHSKPYK